MNANRSRVNAHRLDRSGNRCRRRRGRLRGHRHVQARRLQRVHRIAGRASSADRPSSQDACRRNHRRLALPSWVRLQRRHAGHDHDRGRVRSKCASTPRETPSKPPKAASIAPTTWGARMRSSTTCSSARRTGPSASTSPNNEHRCGPPSTVEECTHDGWVMFNHPAPFNNQGACVAYVNHRKRITLLVPEDPIQ